MIIFVFRVKAWQGHPCSRRVLCGLLPTLEKKGQLGHPLTGAFCAPLLRRNHAHHFDLDGTLIATAPDLISTLNLILSGKGLPPVAYNDGRRMIGGGILGMIERAPNAEGHYPPKLEIDRMFRAFVDHYGAHIANSFASR
jgi:hypothetical protein